MDRRLFLFAMVAADGRLSNAADLPGPVVQLAQAQQSERDGLLAKIPIAKLNDVVQAASLKNFNAVADLTAELISGLQATEQRLYVIYRWITLNVQYDIQSALAGDIENAPSAERVLREKKALCEGFSRLLSKMGVAANIEILQIYGTARTAAPVLPTVAGNNHVWNAVQLNRSWYFLDPTWDAGSYLVAEKKWRQNDGALTWFLAPPEVFNKSHFPHLKKYLFT